MFIETSAKAGFNVKQVLSMLTLFITLSLSYFDKSRLHYLVCITRPHNRVDPKPHVSTCIRMVNRRRQRSSRATMAVVVVVGVDRQVILFCLVCVSFITRDNGFVSVVVSFCFVLKYILYSYDSFLTRYDHFISNNLLSSFFQNFMNNPSFRD